MIDGNEKRNRQLAFELQNSHVCEKRSKSWDPPKWWKSKNPYNESTSEKPTWRSTTDSREFHWNLNTVDSL